MEGVTMERPRTILAAILIAGMLMACCDAAENEKPAPAAVELTASDLSGTANLSNTDRAAFTDKCFARRAELFAYFFKQPTSVKPNEVQGLRGDVDETFPRLCGCLERELEKGLSKMQFMMAETMIEQGTYPDYPGAPMPEFEALKKAAAQRDMSASDFESARQKFRTHASHSAEACSLTLWAPSLARKLGRPELRSYSGPPADELDASPEARRLKAEKFIEDQAVRAYSLCLEGSARGRSRNSNDLPEVIEQASFASCAKNRQIVFDTYRGHTNSFSPETMTAMEQEFQRRLPQIIIKTRELRDARPTPAPIAPAPAK
jgi:hypothetical protein